jgi:hypothetical protein
LFQQDQLVTPCLDHRKPLLDISPLLDEGVPVGLVTKVLRDNERKDLNDTDKIYTMSLLGYTDGQHPSEIHKNSMPTYEKKRSVKYCLALIHLQKDVNIGLIQ